MRQSIAFVVGLVVSIAVVSIVIIATQGVLNDGVSQLGGWLP